MSKYKGLEKRPSKIILSEDTVYEIGVDGVSDIELTNHGGKNSVVYKVTYENGDYMFIGLLPKGMGKNKVKDKEGQLTFDTLFRCYEKLKK